MTAKTTRLRDVEIRAARGNKLAAKSWQTEAPLRMLMNNLDPKVAENPKELVVYGGIGRAARNWECYDKIAECLTNLNSDEPQMAQSGKPVDVLRTHSNAPRVLIANSNLAPHWAMRHADAGYQIAIDCAHEQGLILPILGKA